MAEKKMTGLSARVIKTMGIFSGVQIVNILCSIVRTKLVALWIGPAGVGLFGLYNSAMDMMRSIADMGMRQSVVPSIAGARTPSRLARICYVVRRWNWALGIIVAFITIAISPLLSRITFGDYSHTLGFVLLSVAVFAASVTSSELAILQGRGLISRMAKASVWGALTALAISIPLFYYFRIKSIVPTLLVYAIVTAVAPWLMRSRVEKPNPKPTPRETFREGADFVKLGIYIAAAMFITMACSYVFMSWLNWYADTEMVGYYQTGYIIVTRYMGLLFVAIGMEYYPRLSRVAESRKRVSLFVNHEAIVALWVVLPVATLFMAFDDVAIRLLYDSDFIVAAPYLSLALSGTAFRAISWCMAFVILAKSDGKIYIISEVASNIVFLVSSMIGYAVGGLEGAGVAYIIWYFGYTIIVGYFYLQRYRLSVRPATIYLLVATTCITMSCSIMRLCDLRLPVIVVGVASLALSLYALKSLIFRRKGAKAE